MAKILSIEQKAACFDLIVETMKRYYSNLDEKLESWKPKKKKTKEEVNNGTISFYLFSSKYPRSEWMPVAAWVWKTLDDTERQQAIDHIQAYYKEKYNIKDWVNFMVWPIRYLSEKYRTKKTQAGIDYTNLDIFHRYMRQWKEDLLREQLGEKYQEIKTNRKMSYLYLQP